MVRHLYVHQSPYSFVQGRTFTKSFQPVSKPNFELPIELQHDSMTSAHLVPPSICGAFRSVKAQRFVGEKLVDHAVASKAHCNTAIWSLKSCITLGTGRATYPSTTPIDTSHISKRSKLQAFKEIAYPMG